MHKKVRLKKQVYYLLGFIIILIIGSIYAYNKYQEYEYKKTYEYKLLEHGYNESETKIILQKFKEEKDLNYFLNNKVNSNFVSLTEEKYYLDKNFYKYIEYMNNFRKLDLSTVIRNINIHLDNDFYKSDLKTDIAKDTSMLVNKHYILDNTYNPDDLVSVPQDYAWGEQNSKKVRKVAYDAFLNMWNAAKVDGYYLMINSAYRTYEEQEQVYNNYKKLRGQKYADSIAARPGSSEHQTGLALDIFSKYNNNQNLFKDSEEAKWLAENSYKYGFILRYPEDKVSITGYNYEAWHFRYVGIDIATYIHNNSITFEEYYAYYIEK